MNPIFKTYLPDGFSTVNSYLFVANPQELIDFLKTAFFAEEINRSINPNTGDIGNCILKIGESCIMISQARGQFQNMRTALYLYVDQVDQIFKQAVEQGAEVVIEPMDMDYGDRQGGIVDPSGNYWWISRRLSETGYQE